MDTFQGILPLLTALGVGGVLGAYAQSWFQHKSQVKEQEHELKRTRYYAIVIFMLAKLDPKVGMRHISRVRPDLKSLEDLENEIKTELMNGVLFASDDVIKAMTEFVRKPSYASYIKTVAYMRKDLWGKKTKIDENILTDLIGSNHR